jgi:hypothetical protein
MREEQCGRLVLFSAAHVLLVAMLGKWGDQKNIRSEEEKNVEDSLGARG